MVGGLLRRVISPSCRYGYKSVTTTTNYSVHTEAHLSMTLVLPVVAVVVGLTLHLTICQPCHM